jgi:hypothetical protein
LRRNRVTAAMTSRHEPILRIDYTTLVRDCTLIFEEDEDRNILSTPPSYIPTPLDDRVIDPSLFTIDAERVPAVLQLVNIKVLDMVSTHYRLIE